MGTLLKRGSEGTHFLYSKFIESRSTDEDRRRREHILNIILLGSILMLAAFDAIVLYYSVLEGPAYQEVSFGEFSVILVFFIFLYTLSRAGLFAAASYLLVGAYFLSNSYAAYRWGVNLPTALIGYALLIIIASILLGTRSGFFVTAVISGFIIVLWHFQFYGEMILQKPIPNNSDAVVFAILFILIMTVAWLSNREIEKSLARAWRSEKELKEQRDLLEIKVEERTRELQQAQFEKVKQLYRFAEFGQLASGLFHDILNLLNAISIRVETHGREVGKENLLAKASLKDAFNTTKEVENFIKAIRKQLDHREIIETFSLSEGIEQVILLVSYKAHKERIRIVFHHDRDNPLVYLGNPFKFHQVVINLLLNAVECYDGLPKNDGRDRTVTIALQENKKGVATVRVEDHGYGVPAEIREKIFEPFFTTKDNERGIGIGLATAKKIVEDDFHGTIGVTSAEGKGSTFTVAFPLHHG